MGTVIPFGFIGLRQSGEEEHLIGLLRRTAGELHQTRVRFIRALVIARGIRHVQPAVDQAVKGVVQPRGVDLGAASALIPRSAGQRADHGHLFRTGERQEAVVILQQHHGLARDLPRQLVVGGPVIFRTRILLQCLGGAVDQVEDRIHGLIQHRFIQRAAAHRFHQLGIIDAVARGHLQVLTGLNPADAVILRAPVGYNDALKAPLFTQDIIEQALILRAVDPIQQVIGRHDRPWLGLPDRPLKRGQINLAQRALIHDGLGDIAARLLAVGREVLQRGPHALGLHARDIGRRHLTGEVGVLGKILKVPAAQGGALDVGPRPEDDAHALAERLLAERLAHPADQIAVPGAPRGDRRGETGGRDALIQAEVVALALLLAQAVGAVRHHDGRNAQAFDALQMPEVQAGA